MYNISNVFIYFCCMEKKKKNTWNKSFHFLGELSLPFIYFDKKYFVDKEETCPYRALIIYHLKMGPSDSDADG